MKDFYSSPFADSLQRMGNDVQLFKDLVVMFTEDAPKRLASLYDAIDASDWKIVEEQAHSLRGLVSTFGTNAAAYQHLATIENSVAAGDYAVVPKLRAGLDASLQELESELKGFLGTSDA